MEKLENYISLEKLEVVCNSIEDAHGLPNECYLEGGYTKFERKLLFEDKWVVIGVASNLKQKGEAVPFNLLGIPLIILKDKNNARLAYEELIELYPEHQLSINSKLYLQNAFGKSDVELLNLIK